jgi:hypothetical protein
MTLHAPPTAAQINFNADGIAKDPHKEMSRFKNVLLTAKKVNVPLAA